jgi:hypothetical protein
MVWVPRRSPRDVRGAKRVKINGSGNDFMDN